jgi:hypothetical protein
MENETSIIHDQSRRIDEAFTSAAVFKSQRILSRFQRPKHTRLEFRDFVIEHYYHLRDVRSPEFWKKPESFRDAKHAQFCRAYIFMNAADPAEETSAARMFQNLREMFSDKSCQIIREQLNAQLVEDGFEDQGIGPDGIRRHVRKSPVNVKVK